MMKFKKVMSIILSVLIMVGVFSTATPVIAAEVTEATTEEKTETTEKVEQSEFETAEFEESEPIVIGEDKSRRDESTKHFILSNGTRKAVRYSHPIHYEKNGEWVDIDNSLEYDEESDSYKNKDNSFKVGFGKSFNSEKLLSIENEGYTLEWKYKGSLLRRSIVNAQISEIKEKELRESEKAVKNSKSEIKYKGFEDNCDLEYVVTGNGVKENIILENKSCKNKFVFEVTADGLELVKNEDGSLSALEKETKEEIFYIPAPFMFDAAKEYSYDVEYSIQEIKGKYLITVTASEEWLKAEGRAYPVTVDPVIQTKRAKSAISTTFVASGKPSTNFNDMQDVYIGIESTNYEICRALVKFDLPELNSGDMVIGAYLGLCLHSASFYTSAMPDKQIDAHLVTGSWSDSAVTWNTRPAFDATVYDYNFIKRSDASGGVDLKPFDVTKAVKEWYEGESNNGLMIKAHVEEGSDSEVAARGIFWSDKYNGVEERYPYIEITYRNNKGLENMWSYTSLGVEEAGAANINDYSGNMVYAAPIHSTESSVLPINLIGYFNGYAAGNAVAVKSPAGTNLVRTTIGQGWRLNVQQTLLPSSQYGLTGDDAENYPYVYTDGDGTEHYIQKITEDGETVYKDESGLDLTLTIGEEYNGTAYAYTLKGKDGTSRMTFNVNGNLTNIFNGYGKSMHITYKPATTNLPEKSRILSVTDGSGHKLTFTYNTNSVGVENSYVSKITDSAGREVSFTYTKSTVDESIYNLTKISYPDGTHNNYDYTGYKFKSAENHYGNLINFSYTSASTGSRVKAAREYSKNGDQGQLITFDRTKYNTTVIRSAGMDGYHYNDDSTKGDDDVITTLQFDNAGRTVSQQVKFGNGSAVGSGSYSYTSPTDDTSTSPAKNKVASTGSLGKNVVNLLNGGNCESLSSWNQNASESATTDNAVSNAEKYIGSGSIKLKTTALSAAGVNYMAQSVSGASANSSYTLSAYVKTIGVTEKFSGESNGAYIQLRAFNSSNEEITTVISETIVRETDTAINNGWKRLTVTLPKTTGISSIKAYICFRNMTGKAYFDCIQLETGAVANDYNMLENSSFEKSSSGMPQKWTAENISYSVIDGTVTEGITDSTDANGSYSVKVTGDAAVEKKLHQTVNVESNKNDTYILSGWGGGKPVNSTYHTKQTEGQATTSEEDDEYENTALFEICPKVIYNKKNADGDVVDTDSEYKPAAKFNTTITGWQFASSAFSLKKEERESGFTYDPIKITVIIRYYNQANAVYFDHIMLTKEPSPTYTYDKEGNLVALNANPEQKVDADYDDKGNLTSFTDTVGNETKIEYNENNLPTITESAKGVFSATSYNSNGLVDISHTRNKKSTENTDNLMIIKTNQSYYTDDESTTVDESMFQKSVYDEHGVAAATYTYDYATGNIKTVTDANGAVTTNAYDSSKSRLASVTSEGSTVSYTYSGNRLTKILFGTGSTEEEYSFAFDKWGNVSSTKVGGVTLSSNTYLPRNGALSLTSYGNGDKIEYEYNNLGLKTSAVRTNVLPNSSTETDSFYWSYSADGTPKAHKDSENNRRYVYDYDSLGRLVSQEITNSARTKYIGFLEQSFDLRGNVNKLTYEFGGRSFSQIYSRSKSTLNTESSESYAKDNLPTVYKIASDKYVLYDYDSLNRLNQKTYHLSGSKSLYYNYKFKLSERNDSGDLYRTSQVATEYIVDDVYGYAYDSAGNIIRITKAERKEAGSSTAEVKADSTEAYRSYEYDKLGQLTRENNKTSGKSSVFVYDSLGNIGSKTTYAYSTAETLSNPTGKIDIIYSSSASQNGTGWNKLPTEVRTYNYSAGTTETEDIIYDSIGNPVKYRGVDLTWSGRQLYKYKNSDEKYAEIYRYDADGLRAKTVHYVYSAEVKDYVTTGETRYEYAGDKLVYQVTTDADDVITKELYFFYDSNDNLSYIKYYKNNGAQNGNYFVTTNMQGDVLGLYDSNGSLAVSYEYDAWGNVISVKGSSGAELTLEAHPNHIGIVNPIRYRGYYYNETTKLYYLQSRYYDSEIGRFINADGYITTGQGILSYNMFAYCNNNPVMYSDASGRLPEWAKKLISWTIDIIIAAMGKSKSSKIRLAGDFLEAIKGGYDKGKDIQSIENPLNKPNQIREQYVNDIHNIGNNEYPIQTPSQTIFPDVSEYQVRCSEMFSFLSHDARYSNCMGITFDKTKAQNSIISWDYEVCSELCKNAVIVTFTETVVSIMGVIYE